MSAKKPMPTDDELRQRIKETSITTASGCIEWMGTRSDKGYGRMSLTGKTFQAHRVSWVLAHGPIPDGLWVLHKCDNPPCVNPDHLWLGNVQDNTMDMVNKGRQNRNLRERAKTHCPQGHPYDEENTLYTSQGYRQCRPCYKLRSKIRHQLAREVKVKANTVAEVAGEGMRG